MRRCLLGLTALVLGLAAGIFGSQRPTSSAPTYRLVGWNDLGMHCMDADYSVFAILPPYNNIWAQLMDSSGRLVTNPGTLRVTYAAVADATGSINTTSAGKTTFWDHVQALLGASPAPDVGLKGNAMPGVGNTPQAMTFNAVKRAWVAEGVPITPYDDAGRKNAYPMMHLTAQSADGTVLATTDIVLPVSDEMSCRACHGSNGSPAARPPDGWVNDPNPERDYRLNSLRLHDREAGDPVYAAALATAGYNANGLYDTVVKDGRPILCAACHGSNALGTTGAAGVAPLTRDVHNLHATVSDTGTGQTLNAATNRAACYACHPGSTTRCLRGVMGSAVAPDGTLAIQCQSCHGNMKAVGSASRQGWLNEPTCQSCHTGDAVRNSGQLRYTTVFEPSGAIRPAVSDRFATEPDVPASGLSLYKLSRGHGALLCEACHGSTHAEYPSTHANDNVQSIQVQGHTGLIGECTTCHANVPNTVDGGPHGLHPLGQAWVRSHADAADEGADACQACHGQDYRGTVLSRALGNRTVNAFGSRTFWQGFQIGCYTCHNGPGSDNANRNRPPVVLDDTRLTNIGTSVAFDLQASDPDGDALTLRIVSQAIHGTVALAGRHATYYPEPVFAGQDHFTFGAWDGSTDSNLGTITINVMPIDTPTPGSPSPTPTASGGPPTATPTPPPTVTTGPTSPTPTATVEGPEAEWALFLPFAGRR